MGKITKILQFIKAKQRFFWAAFFLILIFLINSVFPTNMITSEQCNGKNCQKIDDPSLSDEKKTLFVNDIFNSQKGTYYRLFFWEDATKDSNVIIKATNALDKEKIIGELSLAKAGGNKFYELIFQADNNSTDILFEKRENDEAEIKISGVRITQLNIENDNELLKFKPIVSGQFDYNAEDQKQLSIDKKFDQLKETDVILGQIFRPEMDFLTEAELDMDVIKQGNGGGRKFKLDLREVEMNGDVAEIKNNVLSSVDFSFGSIEQYRQADGKFRFPLYARVEKGKYYFLGIDNSKVAVDKFNYLSLKGTSDMDKYTKGTLSVKNKGATYSVDGDLYFKIFGLENKKKDDNAVLIGSTIEDIGRGKGLYNFQLLGKKYDLIDLEDASKDIYFDQNKKAIIGVKSARTTEASYAMYKFNTVYPFSKARIKAVPVDLSWRGVSLAYSYDRKSWKEIPEIMPENNSIADSGYFDFEIDGSGTTNRIYLKIYPREVNSDSNEETGGKYGIEGLSFQADLILK